MVESLREAAFLLQDPLLLERDIRVTVGILGLLKLHSN